MYLCMCACVCVCVCVCASVLCMCCAQEYAIICSWKHLTKSDFVQAMYTACACAYKCVQQACSCTLCEPKTIDKSHRKWYCIQDIIGVWARLKECRIVKHC